MERELDRKKPKDLAVASFWLGSGLALTWLVPSFGLGLALFWLGSDLLFALALALF